VFVRGRGALELNGLARTVWSRSRAFYSKAFMQAGGAGFPLVADALPRVAKNNDASKKVDGTSKKESCASEKDDAAAASTRSTQRKHKEVSVTIHKSPTTHSASSSTQLLVFAFQGAYQWLHELLTADFSDDGRLRAHIKNGVALFSEDIVDGVLLGAKVTCEHAERPRNISLAHVCTSIRSARTAHSSTRTSRRSMSSRSTSWLITAARTRCAHQSAPGVPGKTRCLCAAKGLGFRTTRAVCPSHSSNVHEAAKLLQITYASAVNCACSC
jgi:hypothetical protein